MSNICPYCGRDLNVPNYELDKIRDLLYKNKFLREVIGPGGRTLYFSDGSILHLHDCCSNCDIDRIKEFIGVKNEGDS